MKKTKGFFSIIGKLIVITCCIITTIEVVSIAREIEQIDYYLNSAAASVADTISQNVLYATTIQDSLISSVDYDWHKQEENSTTRELVFTIMLKEHKENTHVSVKYGDAVAVATKVDDSYYVAKFDGLNQVSLEENIHVTVTDGETSKTETVKVFDYSQFDDLVVD